MLILSSRPSGPLIGVFLCGLLFITLFGELLYNLLTTPESVTGSNLLVLAGAGSVLFLVAAGLWYLHLRGLRLNTFMRESQIVPQRRGLILILSPNQTELPVMVMHHHRPVLQHVWLIGMTEQLTIAQTLERLQQIVTEDDTLKGVTIIPVSIDTLDVRTAYDAVERIFSDLIPRGMNEEEVVVDITGGLKTLSVGAALACTLNRWSMSYIQSDYDAGNRPVPNSQRLIALDVNFVPEQPLGPRIELKEL
jgi:hypothetical protein